MRLRTLDLLDLYGLLALIAVPEPIATGGKVADLANAFPLYDANRGRGIHMETSSDLNTEVFKQCHDSQALTRSFDAGNKF